MKNIFTSLTKNDFLKNVSLLVGGTVIAQIIVVGASPILSRLYTPEDFGFFATFMAILGVASTLSLLKYELAIVVEKNKESAKQIQVLSYIILIGFTIIFTIVLKLIPTSIFEKYNLNVGNYIYLLVPLVFFTGIYAIQSNVLNREKRYKLLSTSNIVNKIGIVVFQILFGFIGLKLLGLVFGNLIGLFITVLIIYLVDKKDFLVFNQLEFSSLIKVAKKHYRFPKYTAPQTLLNTLSQQAPIYILGYFYGLEVVGAYWMAMRIIQLPTLLVGNSVRQVYFQKAAEVSLNKEETIKLFNSTTYTLIKLTIIPTILIFFFGKQLFVFVLGSDWEIAGEFARWMMLWIGVGFVIPPTAMSLIIFNKQKLNFIYDALLLSARVLVLILGGIYFKALDTIIIFSIVGLLFNLTLMIYVKFNLINKYNLL
ncbi:lipopolysaccharide biosynthesis protein [Lutibacter sp.]